MNQYEIRIQAALAQSFSLVARIDELKGRWIGGLQLSPQLLNRLRHSALVTSTGASTRIEGARMSDEEIERLMRGLSVQKMAERDAQEVRGYYETLEFVFTNWQSIPFSENSLKQLHSKVMQYSSKDERHSGQYKTLDNRVEMKDAAGQTLAVLFDTTPPYLTPKAMDELVSWTSEALGERQHHPLLVIANFVVEFLKIHPFVDGNGRLSRILTNLLLLRAGYSYVPFVSHEKLIEDRKTDYYVALRQSQASFGTTQETISPWVVFFLSVLLEQAEGAAKLLTTEQLETLLSPKQLQVWQYLQQGDETTPRDIAAATGIVPVTVAQALDRLVQLQKIERLGRGRTTRYRRR